MTTEDDATFLARMTRQYQILEDRIHDICGQDAEQFRTQVADHRRLIEIAVRKSQSNRVPDDDYIAWVNSGFGL